MCLNAVDDVFPIHSTEYGHLTVTCVGTMPESDLEMNTLQVAEKKRVCTSVSIYCCHV